jgi:hypothetical protein
LEEAKVLWAGRGLKVYVFQLMNMMDMMIYN